MPELNDKMVDELSKILSEIDYTSESKTRFYLISMLASISVSLERIAMSLEAFEKEKQKKEN